MSSVVDRFTIFKHGHLLKQNILLRQSSIVKDGGDFFFNTFKDFLKKKYNLDLFEKNDENINNEVKLIYLAIDELTRQIREDGKLIELKDNFKDKDVWNKKLKDYKEEFNSDPSYSRAPLLYIECYIYRSLMSIFLQSKLYSEFDPFFKLKRNSLLNATESTTFLLEYLTKIEHEISCDRLNEFEVFTKFTEVCLWGNKCDLSVSHGLHATKNLNFLIEIEDYRHNIVSNSTKKIFDFFVNLKKTKIIERIDIVLDNSGIELIADLCFVEMLYALKFLDEEKTKIKFHVKSMPWFVSDVLIYDFEWLLNYLKKKFKSKLVQNLAIKWLKLLEKGNWNLSQHFFWTTPYEYAEMKNICSDLYQDLCKSNWILFKGDLNYRKLISDMLWDYSTSFETALREFWPTNISAFRTIKINPVVEIDRPELIKTYPKDWCESGEYALIQFYNKK